MTRAALALPALALTLALGACAAGPGGQPYPPVPSPRVEMRPVPPVSDTALVWRPGDWEWNGSGYVWRPGAYEPAAGHSTSWMPGHWAATSTRYENGAYAAGGYSWVPGHWM